MGDFSGSENKLLSSDLEELIADSIRTKPSHPDHDFRLTLIKVRAMQSLNNSIKELKESIDSSSESSHNLAKRVLWLNVIITGATVIGTILAIINFLKMK